MQILNSHPELEALGLKGTEKIYWQLHSPQLYEQAVRRYEGMVAHLGPLVVRTGNLMHHSPRDSFIVREATTRHDVAWGESRSAMDPEAFDHLFDRVLSYLQGKTIFVQNVFVGAHQDYRFPFRIITETAWHSLFARNMYFTPTDEELETFLPEYTLIHVGGFRADPEEDRTHSDVFVVVNLARKLILIGGTNYAGEIKKAVFSVMNYLLPRQHVLPMRASASLDNHGHVTLFFGRSGTGKTALATDPARLMISDDETAWTSDGIFSIERGGYANIIDISPNIEPDVFDTTRRFGTILENVAIDVDNRQLDLDNDAFTDNTRACYPLTHLPHVLPEGKAGVPSNIIFLVKDAFGVIPLVSRLEYDQPNYYFRLGYTSKFIHGKPVTSFSSCFDEPSMPLHPGLYANLFDKFVHGSNVPVWLVNTGWIGGPYGSGGQRVKLAHTRAIVKAIITGTLDRIERRPDALFGFSVPVHCPDVFEGLLEPCHNWRNEQDYETTARWLIEKFRAVSEEFSVMTG